MTHFSAEIVPVAADISRLTDEVAAFLQAAGVDARATHHVSLVIDELLTNVGMHGGGGTQPASVTLDVLPDRVSGEIGDWGAPFDPRSATPPDLTAPLEDRPIGGLGLHLVQKLTAVLEYRHDGQQNWTTFCVMRDQAPATRGT